MGLLDLVCPVGEADVENIMCIILPIVLLSGSSRTNNNTVFEEAIIGTFESILIIQSTEAKAMATGYEHSRVGREGMT